MAQTKEYNYHLVYKITNILDNKYYIGVHSTNNIEDGYMGSGTLLKKVIKEVGVENFEREIIHFCNTRKEALYIEELIVNDQHLRNVNTYNLVIGGAKGVKTVKEKAIYFNKSKDKVRPIKYKIEPFQRFDENIFYYFNSKVNPFNYISDYWSNKVKENPTNKEYHIRYKISKIIEDNWSKFIDSLTYCANNKHFNKSALKVIDELIEFGFMKNIDIIKQEWLQQYN